MPGPNQRGLLMNLRLHMCLGTPLNRDHHAVPLFPTAYLLSVFLLPTGAGKDMSLLSVRNDITCP